LNAGEGKTTDYVLEIAELDRTDLKVSIQTLAGHQM
jgi:hypothetical protein